MSLTDFQNGLLTGFAAKGKPAGSPELDVTVKFMNGAELYQVSSVKSGGGVYAPTVKPTSEGTVFYGWSNQSGAIIDFGKDFETPVTFNEDTVLTSFFSPDAAQSLYDFYGVSKEDYPELFIGIRNDNTYPNVYVYFAESINNTYYSFYGDYQFVNYRRYIPGDYRGERHTVTAAEIVEWIKNQPVGEYSEGGEERGSVGYTWFYDIFCTVYLPSETMQYRFVYLREENI